MSEKLHPLQTSLSLAQAAAILDECLAVRQKEGLLPLAVAVLDGGGQLVAFKREDGCGVMRYDIAFGKAWAALGMGMSTRLIRDRLANRPAFQSALASASDGRFIPVPGGVLILNEQKSVMGAVGVSGDASDRDEYCAIHAIQVAGLGCEPASHQPEWRNAGL
ncbi:MAG: heme-binding protein [Betaproteobacteria bacterium]|nr:heme-binding protein [Betaproteobacteria bacterium]